jgi:hypothetical protein
MAATQKVSVAMGRDELRLAKTAARAEGVSLSAYVTHAVRERLAESERLEAAREFLATFAPDELPTAEEQRKLLERWARPRSARARGGRGRDARAAKRRRSTVT